jgi:hypothetical protein
MTKAKKLEQFDSLMTQLHKLELAVFDLICNSKFPFTDCVTVKVGDEVDGDYPDHKYRVSISRRSLAVFMVECFGYDGKVERVEFYNEMEVADQSQNQSIFWRSVRHAIWKIGAKEREAANILVLAPGF